MQPTQQDFSRLLAEFTAISIALSAEHDHGRLLEMILSRARMMAGADGGTIYSRTDDNTLKFEIMLTESLGIYKGGTSGVPIDRPCKKAMRLSQALQILGQIKVDTHIDPDLFDAFIWERANLRYAKQYLESDQIDDVDFETIPGYAGPPA